MFNPCDLTADCPATTHSKGCWKGWQESTDDRRPKAAAFFTIQAEYLHLYVGRRAALISERGTHIPFTIDAVTYRPERNQVEVDAFLPHRMAGFAFGPGDIVEVQHAA